MTTSRDPDRLIHHFLLEGAEQLPDQVFDAVRSEIEHKRQRVVIGPWRMPIMNKLMTIGPAAAVVVVAVVLGAQLLGSPASRGLGGKPSNEPSATAEPSDAEPSAEPSDAEPSAEPSRAPGGPLAEGPQPLTDGEGPTLPITVTIPAPDWYGEPHDGILVKNDTADAPDGAGMIVSFDEFYVHGDPCEWSTTRPDSPATTVDALMAALAAQVSRDASEPEDITLDGYAGTSITLRVPDDVDFRRCDQGYFRSWTVSTALEPERYQQGPGQIDEVWAVNVDGELVVIDRSYYEGTPQSVIGELRSIVESIRFE